MAASVNPSRLAAVANPSGSSVAVAGRDGFLETRDTRFFFSGGSAGRTAETLEEMVSRRDRGIAVVTAQPGNGKTMLRTELHRRFSGMGMFCVSLENAWFDFDGVLLEILSQLEGRRVKSAEAGGRYDIVSALKQSLLRRAVGHSRPLVILLDEAQQSDDQTLDGLRSLVNLSSERENHVSVLLFAQQEFSGRLAAHPGLDSRVQFATQLEALTAAETEAYIRHRVAVATESEELPFTGPALSALFDSSRGVARILNRQCKLVLEACQRRGETSVTRQMVQDSVSVTEQQGGWHDSCFLPD